MCTLYKGIPHGIAIINYTDPNDDEESFRGVGVFHQGQLHNSAFTCVDSEGYPYSFTKMENGRPADASYATLFLREDRTQNVDSLEEETPVGGWQYRSGQVDKEMRLNG
jgi:hypothetical protein